MKHFIKTFIIIAPLFFVGPVYAANCADVANELVEELNAEILSVQATEDGCKVKLKLPAQNGKQSRIVTRTISN